MSNETQEHVELTEAQLEAIRKIRTWTDYLALPYLVQQEVRRVAPQLPTELERRFFARINAGVPR
jgi:hypothetical protein